MKSSTSWKDRFLAATFTADVEGNLVREVLSFKASGGSQQQAEALIYEIWDECTERDPKTMNILEDVTCVITGYCSLSNHLFRADFKEEDYYRKIPPRMNSC